MTHLEEILELDDLAKDPGAGDFQSFQQRSKNNQENRCLHQHVFNTPLAVEVVDHMGLQVLAVELFTPYNIVVVARKLHPHESANNEGFRARGATTSYASPFPSDLPATTHE